MVIAHKSLLFACQNKIDASVDLLNQALAKSPVLESVAKDLAKTFAMNIKSCRKRKREMAWWINNKTLKGKVKLGLYST